MKQAHPIRHAAQCLPPATSTRHPCVVRTSTGADRLHQLFDSTAASTVFANFAICSPHEAALLPLGMGSNVYAGRRSTRKRTPPLGRSEIAGRIGSSGGASLGTESIQWRATKAR